MYPWPLPRKGQPLTRYYLDVVWFMQARTQTEGITNFIFLHWLTNKWTRLICNMSTHLYLELDGNNIWSLHCTLLWFYVKRTQILASPIYCPAAANPAPFVNGHTDCDHLYRQLVISLKYPQQIKNDSPHVQGRIFKQDLFSTARKHTIRKNCMQTESQQLQAGLFRGPARLWPPINVLSSDNSCGKGACCLGDKSESECEWEGEIGG